MSSAIFTSIVSILEAEGYTVNTQPQEKQLIFDQRELVIVVDDYNMEVESTTSYMVDATCYINFQLLTSEEVLTVIPALAQTIESQLGYVCGFKFNKPDVNLLGTAYDIKMYFSFREVIQIE